jgi:hypothetical protein
MTEIEQIENYHRSNASIDYNDESFFFIKWAEGKGCDGRLGRTSILLSAAKLPT